MNLSPITGHCGALITEVDLAKPLDPSTVAAIDAAFTDYKVLVFPDQGHVGPREHIALAANFGSVDQEPHWKHQPVDGMVAVKELITDGQGFNGVITDNWHTDGSPREDTNWTSFLKGIDVPPYGRDTLFADMEAAYDNLTREFREFLDPLVAIHSWGVADPSAPPVEHPLIHIHPRSGRKSIYANKVYTRGIKGFRPDESAAILEFLFRQAHIPENQVRVSWKAGTIVAWDNQRTQHYIVQDKPYRRVMHRVMTLRSPAKAISAAA